MIKSGISIPQTAVSAADEFDRKADDFAALAEDAATLEDCLHYRDLEQTWRQRAEAERAQQLSQLLGSSRASGAPA